MPALELLKPGTTAIEVDIRLAPREGEPVIEKQYASSFFATDLCSRLRAASADSLVVTGLTTSGCVRATVVDALQYDYSVVLATEAVADRNPDAHSANLFDLNAKYADVMSLSQVLAQLPQFEPGVLRGHYQVMTGLTPYARLGQLPLWIAIGGLLALVVFLRARQRPEHP